MKNNTKHWDKEIQELEDFFNTATLPDKTLKIDEVTNISNCELFLKNHFSTIKANNGNENYSAYLTRLQKLKALLENSSEEKNSNQTPI